MPKNICLNKNNLVFLHPRKHRNFRNEHSTHASPAISKIYSNWIYQHYINNI